MLLAGGVGGARMARGFAAVVDPARLHVVVNVGDDEKVYGVHVSADVDTVLYTLAGIEGEHGWGVRQDTYDLMERLKALGVDTTFRLGDADHAYCLLRTLALDGGATLTEATDALASALDVRCSVSPATDDPVRTKVGIEGGETLDFQDYFVKRGHTPVVTGLEFEGSATAVASERAIDAIASADVVVIAPSNPLLSIAPILAISGYREALSSRRVVAVSPLIGGAAVKGPLVEMMESLGHPEGTTGIVSIYDGIVDDLVVMSGDSVSTDAMHVHEADTLITSVDASARLAVHILALASGLVPHG